MSSATIFTQPLKAEASLDGRLLTADGKLLAMHLAAGGEDGGLIAIAPLLSLVRQTARLGMGLARDVTIFDGDTAQLLWVETRIDNQIVQISVLSMQPIDIDENSDERFADIESLEGYFDVETDTASRIIALNGQFPAGIDFRFIGRELADCVNFNESDAKGWAKALENERGFTAQQISISGFDGDYNLSARPAFSSAAALLGYHVEIQPAAASSIMSQPLASQPMVDDTERFFGQRLAPALRQPLGRIIANAETIGAKLKGPLRDSYAVYAKDISDAAKHLVSLVDDLGDLEAVERADFETAADKVALGDAARRISGLLALKAADHQIRIILPAENNEVYAKAEFRRVLQILLNLVTNAINYAPGGSAVRIEMAQLGTMVCVTVCDEGSGVAEDDVEKIFEKFERLGRSGDGGSGLGLYISRKLARVMDGDLVVSNSKSGGACFALTLPAFTAD